MLLVTLGHDAQPRLVFQTSQIHQPDGYWAVFLVGGFLADSRQQPFLELLYHFVGPSRRDVVDGLLGRVGAWWC